MYMKLKTLLSVAAIAALLASCGVERHTPDDVPDAPNLSPKFNPSTDRFELKHEFRGSWLTTVSGLDWPAGAKGEAAKKSLIKMIKDIKASGCNVVVFQVISNMDAMYESAVLPWNSVLTGTEGEHPGYDPLQVAVETAHQCEMEIHGWINPLRLGADSRERADNNLLYTHPEWVQKYGSNYYLNPGMPEVRQHLADLATELMTNYDLDGLHIDDYFYPSGLQDNEGTWDDAELYKKYGAGKSLEEWRFANINACVRALYEATHAAKADGVFGVSPAGRLVNTNNLYADPRMWIEEGTIDYLVPQLYWTIDRGDYAAFDMLLRDEWTPIMKGVPLVIGLAAYRHWEATGNDKAFSDINQYVRQLELCRTNNAVAGHVWFRTAHIMDRAFQNLFKNNVYKYESLIPAFGKITDVAPAVPSVRLDGKHIRWDAVPSAEGYAVYVLQRRGIQGVWTANLVHKGEETSYKASGEANYVVISYNGRAKSGPSEVLFVE